jgi:hypothetical protein
VTDAHPGRHRRRRPGRPDGQDTNGRDGYLARWHYADQALLAHLTVRATGPGGITEKVVGVHHADPPAQP